MKFPLPGLCFLYFIVLFFSSGCSDGDESTQPLKEDSQYLDLGANSKVYNNDPYSDIYYDAYGDDSFDMLVDDARRRDTYATYLLGYLYFSTPPYYGIEYNLEKGRRLLEDAWEMGVVDAGYSLYELYREEKGKVDLALDYLEASANRGFILSQRTLGKDYFGLGNVDYFETNYRMAREWYSKAAEQGDGESGTAVAYIYRKGLGVEKNESLAFEWMSRVEGMQYNGYEFGTNGLAIYYEDGIGTKVDLIQSYKYYDLMGTAGISDKKRLSEQMTPEQIQEAIRLSGEWQREHNISMPNSEGYRYR